MWKEPLSGEESIWNEWDRVNIIRILCLTVLCRVSPRAAPWPDAPPTHCAVFGLPPQPKSKWEKYEDEDEPGEEHERNDC